ncbi:MAG: hypothetical protein H6741_24555 [Alphaproteobacteria bacterium]|nr:hypothetical protein [Alphaproteobacteria bacterium]
MHFRLSGLAVLLPSWLIGCGPEGLDADSAAPDEAQQEPVNFDDEPVGPSVGRCVVDTFSVQSLPSGVQVHTSSRWGGARGQLDASEVVMSKEFKAASASWDSDDLEGCLRDVQRAMAPAMRALCAEQVPESVDLRGEASFGHVVAQLGYAGADGFRWYNDIYDGRFALPVLADAREPSTVFNCATETWGY